MSSLFRGNISGTWRNMMSDGNMLFYVVLTHSMLVYTTGKLQSYLDVIRYKVSGQCLSRSKKLALSKKYLGARGFQFSPICPCAEEKYDPIHIDQSQVSFSWIIFVLHYLTLTYSTSSWGQLRDDGGRDVLSSGLATAKLQPLEDWKSTFQWSENARCGLKHRTCSGWTSPGSTGKTKSVAVFRALSEFFGSPGPLMSNISGTYEKSRGVQKHNVSFRQYPIFLTCFLTKTYQTSPLMLARLGLRFRSQVKSKRREDRNQRRWSVALGDSVQNSIHNPKKGSKRSNRNQMIQMFAKPR